MLVWTSQAKFTPIMQICILCAMSPAFTWAIAQKPKLVLLIT